MTLDVTCNLDVPDETSTPAFRKFLSNLERLARSPDTQDQPRPQRAGLVLTNEAGLRRKNPPWQLVEQVVRELDAGFGNSFCCLKDPTGSYIQVLKGMNGMHLECRLYGGPDGYVHLRACYPGESDRPDTLVKLDDRSFGEHRDLIRLDDVVDAFRDFFRVRDNGGWLQWRRLNI